MQKAVLLLLALMITHQLSAQSDSTELKNILLREVMIQNNDHPGNTRIAKQERSMQTATDQVLDNICGVTMIKRGNFAQEPTIRGLNAGQINVTIDGMAIFGACTDRMDPASSYIEPNNLHAVTVSYGANNQTFGSSIGGGFNFKIKQPTLGNARKWSGTMGIGYETNGQALQTLASLNYSGKRLAININGIFRDAENYTAGEGEEIHFSQYRKWNGGIAAKYRLNHHHFIQLNYIQDEGYDIGYPALLMDVAYAKAKIASLSHLYLCDHRHLKRWETKFFYNVIDHAMDDTKRPVEQVPIHMDMPGTSETMGFYSEGKWQKRNHEVKLRFNSYQNLLHAEMTMYPENAAQMFMLTIPDARRSLAGLDISDYIQLTGRFSLLAGGRIDYAGSSIYSDEGKRMLSGIYPGNLSRQEFLYNLYINPALQLNANWTAYAHISRAMRAATLQELYGFYLFNRLDGYDYLGNPDLNRETSWNLSLGGIFQKKKVKIEGQVFGYFINNYITGLKKDGFSTMTIGANGVKQYGNLSSALLCGAEATVNIRFTPTWSFSSTHTYTYGRDPENRALPMIAPYKTVHQINHEKQKYYFNLTGIVTTAQNRVNTVFYGETATPSYGIINLKAGRSFSAKEALFSCSLGIENILDSRYYEHLDIMKIPRNGRNFIGRFTVNF